MSDNFLMCTRAVSKNVFTDEPGPTRYLIVPDGEVPSPAHEVAKLETWVKALRKAATWGKDERVGGPRGDILVFIHGYNTSKKTVMDRHVQLKADMSAAGFKGVVMSFDWPSADSALNYLEDRHDAKVTAMQLVTDGIKVLSDNQTPDCGINIHLLAHSTGAYVVREAFDDADDYRLANNAWTTSQVVFIAGDVSASSMTDGNSATESLYRHCVRLTNYSNLRDSVLKLSNAKRLGMAPRVGRSGLPQNVPTKAVNIDCTEYFKTLESDPAIRARDQIKVIGEFNHSWHIGNKHFAKDLFETLRGDLDRAVIPTRTLDAQGNLQLTDGSI